MADITKCTNTECKLRYFCYRHNAPNGFRQSWGDMTDFDKEGKTCRNMLPDKCPECGGTKSHKRSCNNKHL